MKIERLLYLMWVDASPCVGEWELRSTLESWKGTLGNRRCGEVWGAASKCLMWCLWKEKSS